MIRIYKEGGGRGGLGLEVERWEGIVREVSADPIGLKDPGESEKKVGFFTHLRVSRLLLANSHSIISCSLDH
jgi:hypothetical protein